jgi:hypothetical protein
MNILMWRWFVSNSWKIIVPIGVLVLCGFAGCSTTHKYGISLEGFGFTVGFHCGPAFKPAQLTNAVVVTDPDTLKRIGPDAVVMVVTNRASVPGLR